MRRYDIPYVKNNCPNYYPPVSIQDLSLDELKNKYLKMCGKCNGDPSVCSKCPTPCDYGKRAIQLIANSVYNDPPIPLYGGKTLIERAREENAKRREAMNKEKQEEHKEEIKEIKKKTRKNGNIVIENWYEQAIASEDPIAWIMNAYGCSKTKAKQKIYVYRNTHPESKSETDELLAQSTRAKKQQETPVIIKEEVVEEKVEHPPVKTEVASKQETDIETKLERLMKLQEMQKKAMDEYMRLYNEAKAEYEKIKHKTDILCNAMDIMNDTE